MTALWHRIRNTPRSVLYWIAAALVGIALLLLVVPGYGHIVRAEVASMFGGGFAPASCAHESSSDRYKCWNATLTQELAQDNIVGALDQLGYFLNESPDFISTCHTFAHLVGERAYKDFKAGETVPSSPAMQVCDFGFYHGFMTAFLAESRNFKEVGAFCASMQQKNDNGENSYSRAACFHGIGHGSVISHDAPDWKDPLAIVNEALAVCRSSAQNQDDFLKCAGGAYNGMAYSSFIDRVDHNDPFKICREVTSNDSPIDCYANLASIVFNFTPDKTIQEAINIASPYTPPEYLLRAIPTFADMAAREPNSAKESVATCLKLPQNQKEVCLSGYVDGLVQSEVPEAKERSAYAFCSGDLLPDSERTTCFTNAFVVLIDFWTEAKIENSCQLAPPGGTDACNAALVMWISHHSAK